MIELVINTATHTLIRLVVTLVADYSIESEEISLNTINGKLRFDIADKSDEFSLIEETAEIKVILVNRKVRFVFGVDTPVQAVKMGNVSFEITESNHLVGFLVDGFTDNQWKDLVSTLNFICKK